MANVNPVQVQKYLKGVDYPVNKNDLLKHVVSHPMPLEAPVTTTTCCSNGLCGLMARGCPTMNC